ncbi:protein kinase domain-containing protein [Nannocystaceae bacterium ST9]
MPSLIDDALVERMRERGYALSELLGHGGMGRVWRAHELALDRDVAIKFVTDARSNPVGRQRFVAEARALARVQHPNVVVVYAFGEADEQPYLAYELVAGVGLDTLIGGLTWPRTLAILLDLARGLEAVHAAGVLHRDLKPANAMLTTTGQAKLIDFGLAKILGADPTLIEPDQPRTRSLPELDESESSGDWSSERTVSMVVDVSRLAEFAGASSTTKVGSIVGTPRYVAPEIWLGQAASAQTDVYALGLIAWELLTGRTAHADRQAAALIRSILDEPLEPVGELAPGVPAGLAELVDRAVSKDPSDRQSSAAQLRGELEQIAESLHALRLLPEPGEPDSRHASDDERRIALVRASLTRVLADGRFGPRFYARLFERRPELRPLFPASLREQAIKLTDALRLAVSLLRDPPTLEATLVELGARHVLYGVEEDQLDVVRDTLVELLVELEGERMDAALLDAWVWTWGRLDQAFRQGMRQATRDARERASPITPPTRWARCGSTRVAYRSLGRARGLDLLIVPSWFGHGEQAWRSPEYARWLGRLAEHARVTVFDRLGTGLSDRLVEPLSIASALAEITAVLDAIEAESTLLLGLQEGGVMAERMAAARPDRVRGWIGWGVGPRGLPPARVEPLCRAIDQGWGQPLFAELIAPGRARDPEFLRGWSELLRSGSSPTSAEAALRFAATLEFGASPSAAPGLLLHRLGDRWMPIAGAREAAARTGARLIELEGDDHLPWLGEVGVVEAIVAALPDRAST